MLYDIKYIFRAFIIILSLGLTLTACEEIPDDDIKDVILNVEVERVDSLMWECAFALQQNDTLEAFTAYEQYLQPKRQFFYDLMGIEQYLPMLLRDEKDSLTTADLDSLLASQLIPILANPQMYELLDTIKKVYPYSGSVEELITPPLKRMTLHLKDLSFPDFTTHVSGYVPDGDWRTADQMVPLPRGQFSIGLHYFLGDSFRFYPPNVARYQLKRCRPEYLPVQMVHEIAEGMIPPLEAKKQPRLIDKMVRAGVKQYFIETILPYTPDSLRFQYSSAQMEWADYYEARIYKELIPLLYEADFRVHRDYLTDKPYTTQLSIESAPRIGEYCGWKMVKAYMERNPSLTLEDLMAITDYEKIFKESRYKPL
ncbi:MAG: hypothetical protein AAF927_27245 [Bacteroidota bacterium]